MLESTYIVTFALLITIAYQDFKERMVSVYWLGFLMLASVALSLQYMNPWILAYQVGINVSFLLSQGVLLVCYFRWIKNIKEIQGLIGLADILLVVAMTPLFAPVYYILFYVGALIGTLLGALLMALPQRQKTIPLAGFMAIQLIPVLVLQYSGIWSFYKENRMY